MESTAKFDDFKLSKRIKSMLRVDFKRMCKSRVFYILIACALLMPILMTVMMAMMDGSVSVDPQTGVETVMEGPENTWQNIGTLPGEPLDGDEIFMMCNVNMTFMGVAVFVCLFISEDFRSGYAKNLFTVRAKKGDYVFSKTLAGFVCGALMLVAYFVGTVLGGAIAGLPFTMIGFSVGNLIMCIWSKIMLAPVFVSIYLCMSVIGKQKLWLSMLLSFMVGMFLFTIASIAAPINATILNVLLCTVGSILFGIGLGAVSNTVLKKTSLV